MTKYKMYFLHDPIGNTESQITSFDKDVIQKAMDQGMIIVGVTQDDVREVVKSAEEVIEPQIDITEGIAVVLPSYVDSKVDELANVVESLVDALGVGRLKSSTFNNIKDSIQKIHNETMKTIETDQKMINTSPSIVQKSEK